MNASADSPERLLETLLAAPAGDRLRILRDAGDEPEQTLLAVGEVAARMAASDPGKAMQVNDMYAALADAADSRAAQARARWSRARASAHAGRLEDSLAQSRDAIAFAESNGEVVEAARARLASMQPLGEMGRFDEAIAAGDAAAGALRDAGENRLAGLASINLGMIALRAGDADASLDYFDQAETLLGVDSEWVGHLDINRGETLVVLSRFREARARFEGALARFDRDGAAWLGALAEGNLADLAQREGRPAEALSRFERARRRFEAQDATTQLARLLAEQAEVKAKVGLTAEALSDFRAAIAQMDELGQAVDLPRTRVAYGDLLIEQGRGEEARRELTAAGEAWDVLGRTRDAARVRLHEAEALALDDRLDEAWAMAMDARETLRGRPLDEADAARLCARIALLRDDLSRARELLDDGLAIARDLDVTPLVAECLALRGDVGRQSGDLDGAIRDYAEAANLIERLRDLLQAERFRTHFFRRTASVYESWLTAVLQRGGDSAMAEAFEISERARSRSLLDLVSRALDARSEALGPDDPAEAKIRSEMERLRADINALYSQLDDDTQPGLRRASLRIAAINEFETALQGFESRLAALEGPTGLHAAPATLDDVRAACEPGEALIDYFFAGDELIAFTLTDGVLSVHRGLADRHAVADLVRRVQFQIGRAMRPGGLEGWRAARLIEDASADLREAYDLLLRPLASVWRGCERLIIVPHGPLHGFPFHAAEGDAGPIVREIETAYTLSTSLATRIAATPRRRDLEGPAVIGVPDEAAPFIGAEARDVASKLGATSERTLLNGDADRRRIASAARRASVVHFACHGRFAPEAPLDSGLRLSDGWLTVRDIQAMRWESDLITLSGCETGRGLADRGDEVAGLARSFFAGGATSLLVSLWQVSDVLTRDLMERFYGYWRADGDSVDGMRKSAALRQAQLDMLERNAHPAHWAPFLLMGRP